MKNIKIMKKTYKFLFYKLYRFAISNEKSYPVVWNFVTLATMFELLHLLIFGLILKLFFGVYYYLNPKQFSILLVVVGVIFNYLYFIKNKRIEKINLYFQENQRIVWRDNLLFFGYIIMLFVSGYLTTTIARKLFL